MGSNRLPAKNISQKCGRVQFLRRMVFHSNSLRQCDLVHTDCKEMDLCPIRACFRRKAFLSWHICPKVKFASSSCFNWTKKSLISVWVHYFRKITLMGTKGCALITVLYVSCTIQSRKFCGDFHFLVTGTCCAWRWHHCASGYRRIWILLPMNYNLSILCNNCI